MSTTIPSAAWFIDNHAPSEADIASDRADIAHACADLVFAKLGVDGERVEGAIRELAAKLGRGEGVEG